MHLSNQKKSPFFHISIGLYAHQLKRNAKSLSNYMLWNGINQKLTSISISGGTMQSFNMVQWCSEWWWPLLLLLLLLLCWPLWFIWLPFRWCSARIGDSGFVWQMYSFSKSHNISSVCISTDVVSTNFCRSSNCGAPNRIDFLLDNLDAVGDSFAVVTFEPLVITLESDAICSVGALLCRRFTSTKIGSSARKNSLTASSCAKLLTSLPFTYRKKRGRKSWSNFN